MFHPTQIQQHKFGRRTESEQNKEEETIKSSAPGAIRPSATKNPMATLKLARFPPPAPLRSSYVNLHPRTLQNCLTTFTLSPITTVQIRTPTHYTSRKSCKSNNVTNKRIKSEPAAMEEWSAICVWCGRNHSRGARRWCAAASSRRLHGGRLMVRSEIQQYKFGRRTESEQNKEEETIKSSAPGAIRPSATKNPMATLKLARFPPPAPLRSSYVNLHPRTLQNCLTTFTLSPITTVQIRTPTHYTS
ncbi:hypothetical protein RYX36_002401, partial [Vicia faba]